MCSEPTCFSLRHFEGGVGGYELLELILLGQWIEELRMHPGKSKIAETQTLLGELFPGSIAGSRRLDKLGR
jgi:hypothetical protein